MTTLPGANTSVNAEASPLAGGTGYIVVIAPVAVNADAKPRVFSSPKSILDLYTYAPGVDYAALHIAKTRQQVLFCGIPIATPGAVADVIVTGVLGTSIVTVTAGADGAMEETVGSVKVITPGTVGTNGIVVEISCDGGRTTKRVRLGTATSYTIPYVGITIHFAAGTLLAGDVATFTSSAPMFDSTGIDAARAALQAQQKPARSWLVVGDVADAAHANFVTTAINTYETSKKRFCYARVNTRDRTGIETMSAWVSAMDTAFASIDGQKRLDIAIGRARIVSPITNWYFRRPAAWHVSIREYQHDVHITTWRKEDGPLLDVDLTDEDGTVVEFDEAEVGGGLAGRFTCLRTWGNGPLGAFVAQSLTRDSEGSLLSMTHNLAVANVACTVVQQATENIVGKTLQLNDDGTATRQELSALESKVNSDLAIALLQQHKAGEGPRASKAVWKANTTDDLSVVNATLTGVCELHLNGTIVTVDTVVNVL